MSRAESNATGRVLVDVRALQGPSARRGIGAYVQGLLAGLCELGFGGSLALLLDGGLADPVLPEPAADLPTVSVRRRWHGRFSAYEDAAVLARDLERLRPALFHATTLSLPAGARSKVVATLHDLIPWAWADGRAAMRGERLRYWPGRRLLAAADLVLAVSEATAADARRLAGVRPERIRVVPEGLKPAYRTRAGASERVAGAWGIERPYLLYAGALDIRKDPRALVRAWRVAQAEGSDCELVLAGDAGRQAPPERYLTGVRAIGYVSDEQLADLYAAAACFIFPSRYEGFGLPVLEALACGCPVAAYRNSSLPEVAGTAADLVSDGDAAALGAAAARYLRDPSARERAGRLGAAHGRRFTLKRTAAATIEAYRFLLP